jgi:hypothetical protein
LQLGCGGGGAQIDSGYLEGLESFVWLWVHFSPCWCASGPVSGWG